MEGRQVYGVLALSLAAKAAMVTEIPLKLSLDQRGRELAIEDLRQIAGDPVTYKVNIIG